MTHSDETRRESAAFCERTSTLNAVILRINASLDPDTVLGGAGLVRLPCGPEVVRSGWEGE